MIRKPELDDLEDLNKLSKLSWIKGYSNLLSDEDLQLARETDSFITEERLKENISSDDILTLVCERDGKVVGKTKLAYGDGETQEVIDVEENEVQLRSFYVHPDYWRQGIGSKLLDNIIDRAPEWAEVLKVETLEGAEAVEFYRENGFEQVGKSVLSEEDVEIVEKDYTTVIMKKDLG